MEKRTSEWVKGVQQPDGGWFFYGLPAGGDVEDFEDREVDGVPERRAVYRDQNAREIMEEEAELALETGAPDQDRAEAQARHEQALADAYQRLDDERELQRLEERRQYRQFVAGQVYPALVAKALADDSKQPADDFADNAVFLADRLIAALDRAEALDGASDTEQ